MAVYMGKLSWNLSVLWDLSLSGLFISNIQGQAHVTHLPNSRATALGISERPGLEDSKLQNIREGDPVWGRGASPVFSGVQDTWHVYTDALTPRPQCKQLRALQWAASVTLRHCSFLVLSTNRTFYTCVKERQMGKEEGRTGYVQYRPKKV